VPGLGEGLIEKLSAAGVTTVEALADMTPEQLEAIEGIGPKTVEKISVAVSDFFASLEGGTAEGELAQEATEVQEAAPAAAEEPAAEAAPSGEADSGVDAASGGEPEPSKEETAPSEGKT
jgi:transcription termination/antitermination protein NusA